MQECHCETASLVNAFTKWVIYDVSGLTLRVKKKQCINSNTILHVSAYRAKRKFYR